MEIESTNSGGRAWRDNRWLVLVEFAVVVAIYVARQHHILKVSATPYLLLLAWISLRKPPDLSNFAAVKGNLRFALVMIALLWVLAAFGEELVYRGYLMNRVADLIRGTSTGWIVSLFLISALFGFAHYQQGLTGIIEEGSDGLILGLIYLASRRNLAIPIVAHGVCDTIDIALLFLGKYPGQ